VWEPTPLTGDLDRLVMIPTRIGNLKINQASGAYARWLRDTLNREGIAFGTRVNADRDNTLTLHWN
jgi:hypothetical protein